MKLFNDERKKACHSLMTSFHLNDTIFFKAPGIFFEGGGVEHF